MSNPISFSPAKAKTYVEAMLDAGLEISGVEITSDGCLRILSGKVGFSPATDESRDDEEYQKWLSYER